MGKYGETRDWITVDHVYHVYHVDHGNWGSKECPTERLAAPGLSQRSGHKAQGLRVLVAVWFAEEKPVEVARRNEEATAVDRFLP